MYPTALKWELLSSRVLRYRVNWVQQQYSSSKSASSNSNSNNNSISNRNDECSKCFVGAGSVRS
jgi:hypothetical protein